MASYKSTGNVAAIAFGTMLSISYRAMGDTNVGTLTFRSEERLVLIPKNVLLKRKGDNVSVENMGGEAERQYKKLRPSELDNYIYFEMASHTKETVEQIKAFNGEQFYLVEVIAFILKYLKDQLIDKLSRTVKQFKTTDFDWVITVPVIWDPRGKRMMREAAYLAGLTSDHDSISRLTPVSYRLPIMEEVNPEKLSIIEEPEATAVYCQQIQEYGRLSSPALQACILIDIGGSSTDISYINVRGNGSLIVENAPTVAFCGGNQVNEAFSKFLQEIVSEPGFSRFLAAGDKDRQKNVLKRLLYREFDIQKMVYGDCKTDEVAISLPISFDKFYYKELEEGAKKIHGIEYDELTLYISKEVVERKLFDPTVYKIISSITQSIQCKASTIYLVGGFGGSRYVSSKITAALEKLYQSKRQPCHVIVPPSHHLAASQGAVMWSNYNKI